MIKIISVVLTLVSVNAFATEYLSPRTLALGGAGRAAPLLNDGIYLNPSYSSFTPSYNLSTGYTWFNGGRTYNAAIQDSRTEMFQAGVGFTRREQNSVINIGASKAAIQNLGFGLGAKILIDDGTHKLSTDTIFSTSFIATPWFTSAIIIDNIFQPQSSLQRNLFRTFYLATKFTTMQVVQLYFDPSYAPSYGAGGRFGYAAAVEFSLLADFFLRFGRFANSDVPYANTHGTGFGMGLGWVGPRLTLDYAFHHVSTNDSGLGVLNAHGISMTVFF